MYLRAEEGCICLIPNLRPPVGQKHSHYLVGHAGIYSVFFVLWTLSSGARGVHPVLPVYLILSSTTCRNLPDPLVLWTLSSAGQIDVRMEASLQPQLLSCLPFCAVKTSDSVQPVLSTSSWWCPVMSFN